MKPVLFYAIKRNLDHDVVAVTTEKSGRRGAKWHGRYVCDNTPTHGNTNDMFGSGIMGRFETQDAAEAKVAELSKIRERYRKARLPHEAEMRRLHSAERDEIETACNV